MRGYFTKIAVLLLLTGISNAREFYATPFGTGDGSLNAPWSAYTAFTNGVATSGDTIYLRGGTYTGVHHYTLTGSIKNPIILCSYPGERAIFDGAGITNTGVGYQLYISGTGTVFKDFEVWNSANNHTNTGALTIGVYVVAGNNHFRNLIVHDCTASGIGFWSGATNSEIYGCLIYNNGTSSLDHGIYAQNTHTTKRIVNNIIFNNYGYGIHCYGNAGGINSFLIERNSSFNNGSLKLDNTRQNNFFLGSLDNVMTNNVVANNYGWMPQSAVNGVTFGMGYGGRTNQTLIFTNNVGMGSSTGFDLWTNTIISGNRFVIGSYFRLEPAPGQSNYVNFNQYWSLNGNTVFRYPNDSTQTNWSGWQAAGLDPGGSFAINRPTTNWVFVEPDEYKAGRAHITVFNWSSQPTVLVDLSPILIIGDKFEVRNVQDLFGPPLISATFDGSLVAIHMTSLTSALPVGMTAKPAPTWPQFNSFVVLPKSTVSPPSNLRTLTSP